MQKVRRYTVSLDVPTTLNLPAGSIVRTVHIDSMDSATIYLQIEVGSRRREHRTFQAFARETEIPAGAVYCGSGIRWGGVAVVFVFEIVLT